jgi:periplasmic glucans biosynthesis protein
LAWAAEHEIDAGGACFPGRVRPETMDGDVPNLSRRSLVKALAALPAVQASSSFAQGTLDPGAAGSKPFSRESVIEMARERASRPYEAPSRDVPEALKALNYDEYRDIRFRPERSLLGGNFRLQLFHLCAQFTEPVPINLVRAGGATPIAYDPALFDLGRNRLQAALPVNLGFAGFRLHYPLNDPTIWDELAVFLGASYFRFLGRGQHYGLSSRGVAIGSGYPGEEFPSFREFWIEQPLQTARSIVIHALLDGPSVTGAFRFGVYPDEFTTIDVEASFFPRRDLDRLGVAPLTSMFFVSENDRRFRTDFRPEVHDSDGLLLHNGQGEWIWRPLRNPEQTRISSFVDKGPKGFGLMQRERDFNRYEDLEARYDLRPSTWVEPRGDWGEGNVDLVELAGPDETFDNVAAFWRPKESFRAGSRRDFAYTLRAMTDGATLHPGGKAVATFQTDPVHHGFTGPKPKNARRFLIDFAGGELAYFSKAPEKVSLAPSATGGTVTGQFLMVNPVTQGFRAGIDVTGEPGRTIDLRAFLRSGDMALTETWVFPWTVS